MQSGIFDFFEQQERSKWASRWLVLGYVLAVVFTLASYCAVAEAAYALLAAFGGFSSKWMPWQGFAAVAGVVGGLIGAVSLRTWLRLREGGSAVADLLGASYVSGEHCTPAESRLLNVVEEMAIASRIAPPPVYMLRYEKGINMLVAGYSPDEAVLIATRGTDLLSRDELQGMVGHEFSHILNGDMAFNVRLVAPLAGLTWFGDTAERLFFGAPWQSPGASPEARDADPFLAVFAGALAFIGFPGALAASALRSAISRQREYLADAASVQFTRNPDGIAGALDSILALRASTAVLAAHAGIVAHMFFAPAVPRWWSFPTHPPIARRIYRAHPRFERGAYRAERHGEPESVAILDDVGNVVRYQR